MREISRAAELVSMFGFGKKRKKKKSDEDDEKGMFHLPEEVKRAIWVVSFSALAIIFLLSLLGYAGQIGFYIDAAMRWSFGWGAWLMPPAAVIIALFIVTSKEIKYRAVKITSTVALLFVFAGVMHLNLELWQMVPYAKKGLGGGFGGVAFAYPLVKHTGFWVSLVILIALGSISLLLMFETRLFQLGRGVVWLFSKLQIPGFFSALSSKLWAIRKGPEYIDNRDNEEDKEHSDEEEEKEGEKKQRRLPFILKNKKDKKESDEEEEGKEREKESREDEGEKEVDKKELKEFSSSLRSKYRRNIDIPLSLLEKRDEIPSSGDINANKEKIKKALESFGIEVEMSGTSTGPTVTQYTLKPNEGVKLSQITALHNDLALALAAHPIRIEAPIPGKSLVGVEVPNSVIATVGLREILASKKFKRRTSNLALCIGKDVSGSSYIADLERMPHLLVAGATGSGKSVCINSCIISLLYQNSPDMLKFILVDPKRVELSVYNGIPHLLTPVITDAKKTINALKWTVEEMDRRYDTLSAVGARNLEGYNRGTDEQLPYIIVVIDELADLMSVAAKEVEALIVRLAQMARAVGIHLILATQRPSVNVITGLIKANITARIAFAVASQTDSRTILDSAGAEKMLGRGDMLFTIAELSKPKRLQGAYVSDNEIKKIVDFLKEEAEPDYLEEVVEKKNGFHMPSVQGGMITDEEGDELLSDAREIVVRAGKASASYLQRHLRIGYARAARILDMLEAEGTIGPADGSKPRGILLGKGADDDEYEENDGD